MFTFSQPMTPAVKDHLRAQFSTFTDMSQRLFDTAQKINELNIQVARNAVEDSITTTQQVLSAQNPMEAISIAAGQVQPATERLRAYQQQLTNLAAGAQVDLARTAESRVPETTRTATAVADEVARTASEETQKATERQRAAMEKTSNPIKTPNQPNRAAGAAGGQPTPGH